MNLLRDLIKEDGDYTEVIHKLEVRLKKMEQEFQFFKELLKNNN